MVDCKGGAVVRRLLVIGIGAGDPAHLTQQAIAAIGETDAFVVIDKGDGPDELAGLRRQILVDHASAYRTVTIADGRRDDALPYADAVRAWHGQRVVELQRDPRRRRGRW